MRKHRIILISSGVVLATIVLTGFLWDVPPRAVNFVFLGYTTSGTEPEAVFSVHFPPNFGGCGFGEAAISRKEGAVWKDWSSANRTPPKMRLFSEPSAPTSNEVEPKAVTFAAFPVETTNDIFRIVIEVEEHQRRGGLTAISESLWRWIGLAASGVKGPRYFITNETVIKPAA